MEVLSVLCPGHVTSFNLSHISWLCLRDFSFFGSMVEGGIEGGGRKGMLKCYSFFFPKFHKNLENCLAFHQLT